jgi:DtxR family Mn-dependent transcriptional regulator
LIIGVDGKIANEDACKIEHIVNPKTMDRLTKFVEFVKRFEDSPRWLDHFKHFYETGEYVECTQKTHPYLPFMNINSHDSHLISDKGKI